MRFHILSFSVRSCFSDRHWRPHLWHSVDMPPKTNMTVENHHLFLKRRYIFNWSISSLSFVSFWGCIQKRTIHLNSPGIWGGSKFVASKFVGGKIVPWESDSWDFIEKKTSQQRDRLTCLWNRSYLHPAEAFSKVFFGCLSLLFHFFTYIQPDPCSVEKLFKSHLGHWTGTLFTPPQR